MRLMEYSLKVSFNSMKGRQTEVLGRLHCDSSQGGSEFSRKGCEWLGCTHGQLSLWDSVGRRSIELVSATNKLPVSEHAISLIASLDDIAFPKAIEKLEPGMTQRRVIYSVWQNLQGSTMPPQILPRLDERPGRWRVYLAGVYEVGGHAVSGRVQTLILWQGYG